MKSKVAAFRLLESESFLRINRTTVLYPLYSAFVRFTILRKIFAE